MPAVVYLIPTVLAEGATQCLPAYLVPAIQECTHFFVEAERTARRFLKSVWREINIDALHWQVIREEGGDAARAFREAVAGGHTIGILSEAGCPGVADPGQALVEIAQELGATVRPLVGPSSILLALMASGMNGQQFSFVGYLPIEAGARVQRIRQLEGESRQRNSTQIFIETPYRNNALMETLVRTCAPTTRICVAVDLTAPGEFIRTATARAWLGALPDLHKRPAIFLLHAGERG